MVAFSTDIDLQKNQKPDLESDLRTLEVAELHRNNTNFAYAANNADTDATPGADFNNGGPNGSGFGTSSSWEDFGVSDSSPNVANANEKSTVTWSNPQPSNFDSNVSPDSWNSGVSMSKEWDKFYDGEGSYEAAKATDNGWFDSKFKVGNWEFSVNLNPSDWDIVKSAKGVFDDFLAGVGKYASDIVGSVSDFFNIDSGFSEPEFGTFGDTFSNQAWNDPSYLTSPGASYYNEKDSNNSLFTIGGNNYQTSCGLSADCLNGKSAAAVADYRNLPGLSEIEREYLTLRATTVDGVVDKVTPDSRREAWEKEAFQA